MPGTPYSIVDTQEMHLPKISLLPLRTCNFRRTDLETKHFEHSTKTTSHQPSLALGNVAMKTNHKCMPMAQGAYSTGGGR